MAQIAVICDDMTGAMEAALQLRNRGLKVYILLEPEHEAVFKKNFNAFVFVTNSRNVDEDTAEQKIKKVYQAIEKRKLKLIYKKVDSTLRGNIGKEIEAIIQEAKFNMVAFVPALPFNGRTTREGYHYLNGKKLTESDLSHDPFSPVNDSYIPNIIKKQTQLKLAVIKLEEVRKGEENLAKSLKELSLIGYQIAIIDAVTDNDLQVIADVLEKNLFNILPCGSAGLFSKMSVPIIQNNKKIYFNKLHNDKPILIISGSPAENTKNQITRAKAYGCNVIELNASILENAVALESELQNLKRLAIFSLENGKNVIIDGAGQSKSTIFMRYRDKPQCLIEDSIKIQDALAFLFKEIIQEFNLAGVMVIGGDTIANICTNLNVKGLEIIGEVEPFIPVGKMFVNQYNTIPVVSKAGGFGTENIIIQSIQYLKGEDKRDDKE